MLDVFCKSSLIFTVTFKGSEITVPILQIWKQSPRKVKTASGHTVLGGEAGSGVGPASKSLLGLAVRAEKTAVPDKGEGQTSVQETSPGHHLAASHIERPGRLGKT